MNYEAELSFAKDLAMQARKIALKYYKTKLQYITKGDNSPVTIADEAINQIVIDTVKQQFPDHGVLGEEQSWQRDRQLLWVCDPIDGTVAFSMGEPIFMFSLALVDNGKPVVAVTLDLANGDIFWATTGGGAYMNGEHIHVSTRALKDGWLAFPTNLKVLIDAQEMYTNLSAQAYQTNIIHGAVFKGMLIAQGLCDASVWPRLVHPWDAAAVKLIVEEAGGRLTDFSNHEHRFDIDLAGGMIITNGFMHSEVLEVINR